MTDLQKQHMIVSFFVLLLKNEYTITIYVGMYGTSWQ